MNIKSKLLAVLLISLTVFVGGGFVLYNQYQGNNMVIRILQKILPESEAVIWENEFAPVSTGRNLNYKGSKQVNGGSGSNDVLPIIDSEINNISGISSTRTSSNGSVAIGHLPKSNKEIRTSGDTNRDIGLVAYGGSSSSARGIGESSSGGGASSGFVGGPMAVPFAKDGGDWALVDPEPITNEQKDQIVPVGDSVIALMLLSLAYGFVIFRRRKNLIYSAKR